MAIIAAAGLYLAFTGSTEWPQLAAAALTALLSASVVRREASVGKLRFRKAPAPLLPPESSLPQSLAESARLFAVRPELPAAAHDVKIATGAPARRAIWTAWLSFLPDGYVVAVHRRALRVRKAFGKERW